MGRKKKYYTDKEKKEAQRQWQMDHYERNKAKILKKSSEAPYTLLAPLFKLRTYLSKALPGPV